MKINLLNRFGIVVFFAAFLIFAGSAGAQNMSGTVVTKEVKFAKGKHEASLTGRAKYGMSYVYRLGAKGGQTMDVTLKSNNRDLTFSIIGPDEETLADAFGVTEFSGKLPANGKYSVVVVLNDQNAGTVQFALTAGIK